MARHLNIDQLAVNTIRTLVIDAIQQPKSGHLGTPIDAAPNQLGPVHSLQFPG